MLFMKPTPIQRYAVAVVAVAVAFGLRYGIYGTLDHRIPFGFFTPATLIAAWYGGLGPGMLAALAGLLLGDYFFLPPHQSDSGTLGEAERTAIGSYAMTNTLIVVLFWRLHSRLRELEDQLRKLQGGAAQSK
jgi:K+-sensing histidine kinase KdpD